MENLGLTFLLCFSVCLAGLSRAQEAACPAGKYGPSCNLKCGHCQNTAACDKATGNCPSGCAPGWSGSPCKTACPDGTYGQNCASSCGQCEGGGATCTKTTGVCQRGCKPGYQGATCDQKCPHGKYGLKCKSNCGHCSQGACDHVTGDCSSCASGFSLPKCTKECDAGGWGADCLSVCSDHCEDPSACDKKTGHCPCRPGYQPDVCTEDCPDGHYGQNCLENCGKCLGGHSDCHHETGNCTRCMDNYQMPLCQECIPGKYGSTCGLSCSHCGGDRRCNKTTGECVSSNCQPGWKSPKCDQKCPVGFYGAGCKRKCGHCHDNAPCNHEKGVCENDCEEGYEGVLCSKTKESLAGPVVGAIMGAGILIAIAVVASVCYLKRNSKKRTITSSKEDLNGVTEMRSMDTEDGTGTPQVSEVYQNMQVNHGNSCNEQALLSPASNYDRVDMTLKESDVHHYDSHVALQGAAAAPAPAPAPAPVQTPLPERMESQEDHLYQNAQEILSTPAVDTMPEEMYGNV